MDEYGDDEYPPLEERGKKAIQLDDVKAALGDTDPRHTNAAAIRRTIGRGSLSTIQKYLEVLRDMREAGELGLDGVLREGNYEDVIAPAAPEGIMRGIWESAYMAAIATVQDRLIRAQERAAELDNARQAQIKEIEAITELADQIQADLDAALGEAKAARDAQAKAEAERDEALKLREQIAALMAKIDAMQPQV